MDIIDVDSELKNETSRFYQEKLHDDVVNIIQQWKINNIDLDNQFKGRTYTKVKRRGNLFENDQKININLKKKLSNMNMEIGGLVTSNEKNNLSNVSPPHSIFSSTNLMENSMGNSLITSMDFIDVSAFENNEIDEEYFAINLKNLKEKFGNNSKSTSDNNNLNDLNTSFELNEKYLTINLKKDRPAFSIPSCSSDDFTSDEIIDSSSSPILEDENKSIIVHNNINLDNTYNLLDNSENKTITLNKNGDAILNSTYDMRLDNVENVTFVQSTPLRNQNINDIITKIDDDLELSPVPRTVSSMPITIEKIKNRYSINNNGSLEKSLQQVTEIVKDLNTYSPQNGRLLAKRNRIYEVQDINVNEFEKDQNITKNLSKDILKTENKSFIEKRSKNLDANKLNLTCTLDTQNENMIQNEIESVQNKEKQSKISLLKHRIPRDLSADRTLNYGKNQHFSACESRLKKPINKDIVNVQTNQYYTQTDNSGSNNNIQRASSASDIAKRTENVAQQNLETKSKSFKNLSSNLNQAYRKSSLIAPSKISYRVDVNNFAVPIPVRKISHGSGIPHRPLPINDAPKLTSASTPMLNGTGKLQPPQPSRLKRSGLPRPSKLH